MIAHGFFYSKVWWSVAWMGFIRKFGGRLFGRGRFFAVGVWQFIVQYGRCVCFVLVESAIRIRICISTWHAIVFGGGLIFVLGSFIFYVVFVGLFVRWFVVWGCLGVFVFAFVGGLSLERFSLRGVAMVLWARFGVLSFLLGSRCAFVSGGQFRWRWRGFSGHIIVGIPRGYLREMKWLLASNKAYFFKVLRVTLISFKPSLQALRAETMVERFTARMHVLSPSIDYPLGLTKCDY